MGGSLCVGTVVAAYFTDRLILGPHFGFAVLLAWQGFRLLDRRSESPNTVLTVSSILGGWSLATLAIHFGNELFTMDA
jgi:hypothetical protein